MDTVAMMADEMTPGPIGGFVSRAVTDSSAGGTFGGSGSGLAFHLEWEPGTDELVKQLTFFFAGHRVWTTPRSVATGIWDCFLSGMAEAWLALRAEQTYPLGTTPRLPSLAFDALLKEVIDAEEARSLYRAFRRHHDVAAWFADSDLAPPPLFLMREGRMVVAETGDQFLRWHVADVIGTLERLGDALEARLATCAEVLPSIAKWRARNDRPEEQVAALALGVDVARLRSLRAAGVTHRGLDRRELLSGLDEVQAAARMLTARLDDDEIAKIADLIRSQQHRATSDLDAFSREALRVIAKAEGDLPRVQGQKLANWLRNELECMRPAYRVDPKTLLTDWNVSVVPFSTDPRVEAVCFWGARFGPAILLNQDGRTSGGASDRSSISSSGGARATLAHEICHLLVDRSGALPAAEVLGGSVPYAPEERARSFAAEFLLPRAFAGDVYRLKPTVEDAIKSLSKTYGVSRTVAAWQMLNHFGRNEAILPRSDRSKLQKIVDPNRFHRQAAAAPAMF